MGIRPLSGLRKVIYRSFTTFLMVTALLVALLSSAITLVLVEAVITDFSKDLLKDREGKTDLVNQVIEKHFPHIVFLSFVPPLIGASVVVLVFRRKVSSAVSRLREKALQLSSKDVNTSYLEREDLGFEELNEIKDKIVAVFKELEEAEVAKQLAEVELKLTKTLLIPYSNVRDWNRAVQGIVGRLSEVINLDCLVVGFMSAPEKVEIHAFWLCKRDTSYEELIKEKVREYYKDIEEISLIVHQLSDGERNAQNREITYIALKDVSVGQVVCAGLVLNDVEPQLLKVVEGFLPALVSVVGSTRALESYAREIEYYATRDALTGLYNQRMFWELLEYEIERAKKRNYQFAVLIIDIDNFKVINDTYGHSFGDEFLKHLARLLEETFRREDIVARYGGDEFAVILPYTSQEEAFRTAQRLLRELESFSVSAPDGKPVKATVSIGIAVFPTHGESARELFMVADNIMYRIKSEGKNRVALPSTTDFERIRKTEGRTGMLILDAIEKRSVVPVFQPIVDVGSGDVHAYEVLMRIRQNGKLIPASEFVHVAERMGVIHRLDHMLIDRALSVAVEHNFRGRLFFNLTPRALVLEDFIKEMRSLIDRYSFDPDQIVFEITERETVRNMDMLKDLSMSLKGEGFHFAVDDFGSGFSSFMYLKHIPVDYVKIEGEFIRSILDSRMDRAFVISVIALAETLGIKTVAEFVENEKIFSAVKSIGVNYAQGYYIGKPDTRLIFQKNT